MDSAIVGEVLWQDRKISERNIGRVIDGFTFPNQIKAGWNPYVSFLCVRADEGNIGDLLTYTSSSWGGRRAFRSLLNPYRLMGKHKFPICVLGTKDRNDENGNIDPTFKIVGWSDRKNFAELVPADPLTAAIAPPQVSKRVAELIDGDTQKGVAELIDDDIPF